MKITDDIRNALHCYRLNYSGSTAEMARTLGVTPQHLNQLMKHTKEFIKDDTWDKLMPHLLPYLRDKQSMVSANNNIVNKKVPLLTVAQAATDQPNSKFFEVLDGDTSEFTNPKDGDFAIIVSGNSMLPWYPPGTHLLVGRNEIPQTGDRVVAMLADRAEPIFKVFIDKGDCFQLLSINQADGVEAITLNKMDRNEWYWCFPIKESRRNERDLDLAMKAAGIKHFWESEN